MSSAVGLGAFLAAIFSGWTTNVRRPGRAVMISVAVWSLGIVGFGLATFSFPLALLFLAIASGADVFSAVLRSAIVQLLTPDALRGRVSSIHILVVTGGPRIGDAEASAVAAVMGTQFSVVSGGILSLIGLGAIALANARSSGGWTWRRRRRRQRRERAWRHRRRPADPRLLASRRRQEFCPDRSSHLTQCGRRE